MDKNLDIAKPRYSEQIFPVSWPLILLYQGSIVYYVVISFYPCFKFYFLLLLGMVLYVYGFETKGNKI